MVETLDLNNIKGFDQLRRERIEFDQMVKNLHPFLNRPQVRHIGQNPPSKIFRELEEKMLTELPLERVIKCYSTFLKYLSEEDPNIFSYFEHTFTYLFLEKRMNQEGLRLLLYEYLAFRTLGFYYRLCKEYLNYLKKENSELLNSERKET